MRNLPPLGRPHRVPGGILWTAPTKSGSTTARPRARDTTASQSTGNSSARAGDRAVLHANVIDSDFLALALAKLAPVVLDIEPTPECQELFLAPQSNELLECVPHGLSLRRRVGKPHEVSK